MDTEQQSPRVNRFARRSRHLRIFSKKNLIKIHLKDFFTYISKPFKKPVLFLNKILLFLPFFIKSITPASPQKRILFNASLFSIFVLFITSIGNTTVHVAADMTYNQEYMMEYSIPGDILITDQDGYLVKINPQTDDSNRIGMTDFALHTIEPGESLSIIAEEYGVSSDTIMWENNLANANSIRAGQKLKIPPVTGITYKVKRGDSIEKIADKYKIKTSDIVAQNGLSSNDVFKGQTLFLPDAKPITPSKPVYIANNHNVSSGVGNTDYSKVHASNAVVAPSRIFIKPTKGVITQGYHAGHHAIDISDRSKPPVYAAGAGTIIKASSGTWGGGYGNHIIIDHGGGLKTLYGHLDSLNVKVGDYVNQGDVIGIQGNTGRVYGVTGIHLHWEVIQNGVKQNPALYY